MSSRLTLNVESLCRMVAIDTANTTTNILSNIQTGLDTFKADPLTALQSINLQSIAIVGLSVVFIVFLVDLIAYLFALYKGTEEEFTPYSRSMAVMVADAWDNRNENDISYYYDPYVRGR